MKRIRFFTLLGSSVVSLGMVLIAFSLGTFAPRGPGELKLIIGLLLTLSPLPVVVSVALLRAIAAFAREAEKFSTRDPLTSLYNQPTFWDLLEYETERSKRQNYRFSLLLIDIDNFKAINDTYGHEVGDAFLVEFSSLLKTVIRKGDIPARYGGDKFTAILPVCDESQAYIVAKRLINNLREFSHTLPDGARVRETASVGIAVFPDHARDAKDLFLLADGMLGHAKATGKDRLSFPSDDVNISTLRSAGEKSILIMEAIREKRIAPYFQPIINVQDRTVFAYEVLTRILTADRVIPAAEFIEAAEGMGAIGKIDFLLIEQAFDTVKRLGYTGNIFINLSPKALVLNEFIPTVLKLLKEHGLSPYQMVFEITERETVKNLGLIANFIHELKRQGFRFAIDDFGSGYSSFLYIRTFEVDFVKVDGEFIRNMTGAGGMERAIVKNIASLAGNLGIKTIAEYVESEQILEEVRSAGIDYAQGYHIQRPSPGLT
jgi:diguanylate cyclase (GGDEF)-like protein